MKEQPLAVDLFCGLGGWSEGLLAEGFYVVGFDIERHEYGDMKYPGQLVIQDVLTLHGSQFKEASLIVASPPCQEFSYMAMPWSRGKAKAAAIRADTTGAELRRLTRLFDACFRIQREACAAAGHHVPMVVENVRGAIPWVGRARWNHGSFYLWGCVPALMPQRLLGTKTSGRSLSKDAIAKWGPHNMGKGAPMLAEIAGNREGCKVPGFRFDGSGKSFQSASVAESGVKCGGDWFNASQPSISRCTSSKSPARKMASAMIAKIPEPLSRHIARTYRPRAAPSKGREGG